jgi:hypothetical protein
MRAPRRWCARAAGLAALCVLLGLPATRAAASAFGIPELMGSLGGTFAISGDVKEGGAAVQIGGLWPVGGPSSPASVGLGVWAADAGQQVVRLLDPNDGTDLGAVGGQALTTFGAGLVADVRPDLWRGRNDVGAATGLFLSGAFGYYKVNTSVQQNPVSDDGSLGWSAGGGWRFRLAHGVTIGPAIHYHRLVFDDHLGRFMTAGLDWAWR